MSHFQSHPFAFGTLALFYTKDLWTWIIGLYKWPWTPQSIQSQAACCPQQHGSRSGLVCQTPWHFWASFSKEDCLEACSLVGLWHSLQDIFPYRGRSGNSVCIKSCPLSYCYIGTGVALPLNALREIESIILHKDASQHCHLEDFQSRDSIRSLIICVTIPITAKEKPPYTDCLLSYRYNSNCSANISFSPPRPTCEVSIIVTPIS